MRYSERDTIRRRWQVLALCMFATSGCGALYTSPTLNPDDPDVSISVSVVKMSVDAVQLANTVPYTPRQLPGSFKPAYSNTTRQLPVPRVSLPPRRVAPSAPDAGTDTPAGTLPPGVTAPVVPPPALEVRLPDPAPGQPYRIGVADRLLISLQRDDDLPATGVNQQQAQRQSYIVQDDGSVALPDLGRLQVAGLTLLEAQNILFETLVSQQRDPSFSLEIADFRSQRVSIGGNVAAPKLAPITLKPLFLEEALQLAGGATTEDPTTTVVRLLRDGALYQVSLAELYANPDLPRVRLRDGDAVFVDTSDELDRARAYFEEQLRLREAQIDEQRFAFERRRSAFQDAQFEATLQQIELQRLRIEQDVRNLRLAVENQNRLLRSDRRETDESLRDAFLRRLELDAVPRDFAYLAGEVEKQGRFTLPFERIATLADVMFAAGGIPTATGDVSRIYVLRLAPDGRQLLAYHLDARNVANFALATQFEIRPNDILFVSEQPVTVWNRIVGQLIPNFFTSAADLALRV